MATLGFRIADLVATTLEALAGLTFTVGLICIALGFGGRW
jgi:hypothetical protein